MKKKIILIIIIILIILIGVANFTLLNNEKTVKVGDATFSIPSGYKVGTPNNLGDTNITNGVNSIFIKEHSTTDLHRYLVEYENYIKSLNDTVKVTCSTVDNGNVYKVEKNNDSKVIHYFFVKNGRTYEIYVWENNPNLDNLVQELIKSINSNNK